MIPERQSFRSRGKLVNIATANMLKSLGSAVQNTTPFAPGKTRMCYSPQATRISRQSRSQRPRSFWSATGIGTSGVPIFPARDKKGPLGTRLISRSKYSTVLDQLLGVGRCASVQLLNWLLVQCSQVRFNKSTPSANGLIITRDWKCDR